MSVKRRDLVRYLEENGFALLREGKNHSGHLAQLAKACL
jgi:Holliday junction resolvase